MRVVQACVVRGRGRLFLILMTMMKHASLALTLVLGVALFGSPASAQLLDAAGSVNLTGSTTSNEAATDTAIDVSVDAEADTNDTVAPSAGSAFSFTVERSSMDEDTTYSTTDADLVRSEGSLESYASATVRADKRFESLTIENGELEMEYRKAAKFLWIIPASMKVHVTANVSGDVAVRYPWYAFLLQAEEKRADLEARLETEIADINSSIEVANSTELSGGTRGSGISGDSEVRRWARIIESVYVAVSGSTHVDASAETTS